MLQSCLRTEDSPGKGLDISWCEHVLLIGNEDSIPLASPAGEGEEFDFFENEPTGSSRRKNKGTMRLKDVNILPKKSNTGGWNLAENSIKDNHTAGKEDVILEGYLKLQKQIGMKTTWMKRFVRLTSDSFAFYRTPEAESALKTFDLNTETYAKEIKHIFGDDNTAFAFQINSGKGAALIFKTTDQRELTLWLSSICTVIDHVQGNDDVDGGSDDYSFEEENVDANVTEDGNKFSNEFGDDFREDVVPLNGDESSEMEWIEENSNSREMISERSIETADPITPINEIETKIEAEPIPVQIGEDDVIQDDNTIVGEESGDSENKEQLKNSRTLAIEKLQQKILQLESVDPISVVSEVTVGEESKDIVIEDDNDNNESIDPIEELGPVVAQKPPAPLPPDENGDTNTKKSRKKTTRKTPKKLSSPCTSKEESSEQSSKKKRRRKKKDTFEVTVSEDVSEPATVDAPRKSSKKRTKTKSKPIKTVSDESGDVDPTKKKKKKKTTKKKRTKTHSKTTKDKSNESMGEVKDSSLDFNENENIAQDDVPENNNVEKDLLEQDTDVIVLDKDIDENIEERPHDDNDSTPDANNDESNITEPEQVEPQDVKEVYNDQPDYEPVLQEEERDIVIDKLPSKEDIIVEEKENDEINQEYELQRLEEERFAKEEEERISKEGEIQKQQEQEAAQKQKEEEERIAQEEVDRLVKEEEEEEERIAKEEADKVAKESEEKRLEEERIAKEQDETKKKKKEEEIIAKEEEQRLEEERLAKEEKERLDREQEEANKKLEEERLAKEEEVAQKQKEEEDRITQEEADRFVKEEEKERIAKEEADRHVQKKLHEERLEKEKEEELRREEEKKQQEEQNVLEEEERIAEERKVLEEKKDLEEKKIAEAKKLEEESNRKKEEEEIKESEKKAEEDTSNSKKCTEKDEMQLKMEALEKAENDRLNKYILGGGRARPFKPKTRVVTKPVPVQQSYSIPKKDNSSNIPAPEPRESSQRVGFGNVSNLKRLFEQS